MARKIKESIMSNFFSIESKSIRITAPKNYYWRKDAQQNTDIYYMFGFSLQKKKVEC